MQYETILANLADGVFTITLNRPDTLNAFNDRMIRETTTAFKNAGKNADVRVVVLTGAGRGFSSGQDLKDMQGRDEAISIGDHLRHGYNKLISTMLKLEKPIIGSINGVAAGAGCSVALATDIRIASHKASFIQVFSNVGLVPDSGSTWILPRLIGYARAYQMAITAEKIKAEQALAWGLVNEVVPADQLPEITSAWANRLATGATQAFGLTKRAMRRGLTSSLNEALEYEAYLQDIASETDDHKEGINAFLEKRKATFQGK